MEKDKTRYLSIIAIAAIIGNIGWMLNYCLDNEYIPWDLQKMRP